MSYGMDVNVGLSFQNSYGTALVNSIYWLPLLSEGISLKKEPIKAEGMRGIYDEGASYEGQNMIEGDITNEIDARLFGVMCKAFFGSPVTSTTGVSSGVLYTHTFKPAQDDFDLYAAKIPLTITKVMDDAGSAHRYYDMQAGKLSVNIANGQLVKATLGLMGGKYAQVVAPTATYSASALFPFDVASASLGGTAKPEVRELNIEADDSLENIYTLSGAKTPSRTKRSGFRTIQISGTLVFDTQTEYQQFLSQSERELVVTLTGSTQVQSGFYETITFKTPLARHAEFEMVGDGPGKVEASFTMDAKYSVTSGTALQAIVANGQAAY